MLARSLLIKKGKKKEEEEQITFTFQCSEDNFQ